MLQQSLFPLLKGYAELNSLFFYGAGCNSPEKNRMIEEIFSEEMPLRVAIESDLLGAARALCGRSAGVACILGTGSNSCFYDGSRIVEQVSPLGYLLGDEGSGAVLGRELVGDCLKRQLPAELTERFFQRFNLTAAEILEQVYRRPFPNRFLAGLVPFLSEEIAQPEIRELVRRNFERFFIRNLFHYTDVSNHSIHFTGSVAWYFRDILQEVAQSLHLQIGEICQSPMGGLVAFHQQQLQSNPL